MNTRGADAEEAALDFLSAQGLQLLTRNFRCRHGEIDLVMRHGDTLVFVEVRQRASEAFGGAAASITTAKQRRIIAAAGHYLTRLQRTPACRFDVVLLAGSGAPRWLRNAFDA